MPRFWDVEQRPDREILIRCHCGGDHFLVFSAAEYRWSESEAEAYWEIDVLDEWRPLFSLRGKLKAIWDIFRSEHIGRGHSVGLNEEDVIKIRDWCSTLLESELRPESEE